jgi:hypothetical protein
VQAPRHEDGAAVLLNSFLTSAADGGELSHVADASNTEKGPPASITKEVGCSQSGFGRDEGKNTWSPIT